MPGLALGTAWLTLVLLAMEGAAWGLVVGGLPWLGLGAHGLGVAASVALVRRLAPGSWWPILGLTSLVLALPLIGALALVLGVAPALRRAEAARRSPLELVRSVEYVGRRSEVSSPEAMGIRQVLLTSERASERLEAVLALRRMADHLAVPFLRAAFRDENEEVRLSAFADLERRESRLRAQIERELLALQDESRLSRPRRAQVRRALAEYHWELVYRGFVGGALEEKTLQSGVAHAQESLSLQFRGATAILLARMQLRLRQPKAAWRTLQAAERSGVARAVCAPLFAEAAYSSRRFDSVAPLLAAAPRWQLRRASLDSVVDFWTDWSARAHSSSGPTRNGSKAVSN